MGLGRMETGERVEYLHVSVQQEHEQLEQGCILLVVFQLLDCRGSMEVEVEDVPAADEFSDRADGNGFDVSQIAAAHVLQSVQDISSTWSSKSCADIPGFWTFILFFALSFS